MKNTVEVREVLSSGSQSFPEKGAFCVDGRKHSSLFKRGRRADLRIIIFTATSTIYLRMFVSSIPAGTINIE